MVRRVITVAAGCFLVAKSLTRVTTRSVFVGLFGLELIFIGVAPHDCKSRSRHLRVRRASRYVNRSEKLF